MFSFRGAWRGAQPLVLSVGWGLLWSKHVPGLDTTIPTHSSYPIEVMLGFVFFLQLHANLGVIKIFVSQHLAVIRISTGINLDINQTDGRRVLIHKRDFPSQWTRRILNVMARKNHKSYKFTKDYRTKSNVRTNDLLGPSVGPMSRPECSLSPKTSSSSRDNEIKSLAAGFRCITIPTDQSRQNVPYTLLLPLIVFLLVWRNMNCAASNIY